MKRQGEVVAAKGCEENVHRIAGLCRSLESPEQSAIRVRSMTAVSARMVVQMKDDSWDAVVTSEVLGTYLIRRHKGYLSSSCPLLGYEIRHVDVDLPHSACERAEESRAMDGLLK